MAPDPKALRSRRALLTAAAGGAAAIAATAAAPASVFAVPTAVLTDTDNHTTADTSITNDTDGSIALRTITAGVGPALLAANLVGDPIANPSPDPAALPITSAAGVYATSADSSGAAPVYATTYTGAYGWAPSIPDPTTFAAGVWGDSEDVGVYGTGSIGARGDGFYGMVAAGAAGGGTGLLAWGGSGSGADVALDVRGRAKFSRSGRSTMGAGKSSIKVNMTGVSWSSLVFAVLRSNRSGRYVRAVVPTTGSFTIYLNATVSSSTYVVWFVVN